MLEIVLWYIVPNVVMFSSLYVIGRCIEDFTWFLIQNYAYIMASGLYLKRD